MLQHFAIALLFSLSGIAGWKEYVDTGKHYKFKYPDTWTQQDMGGLATAFLSPKEGDGDSFQENLNLITRDLSTQPMDLQQLTDATKKQIEELLGKEALLSLKDATLAKQKAKELVYNMQYESKQLKVKQYFFIKDKTAYIFTYTAEPDKFAKYESIATESMMSLELF